MKIKGSLEYKKAITIDSDRMRQLNDILMHYCEKIEYTAYLSNGCTESYESVEDLLSIENYDCNRIIKVDIWAYSYQNNNDISLSIGVNDWESYLFAYATICRVRYSFCDRKAADDFVKETEKLLKKC